MSISLKILSKPATLLSLAAALGLSMTGQAKATTLTNLNFDTYFTGETLSSVPGSPVITAASNPVLQTDGPGIGDTVGNLGNAVYKITAGSFDVGDYVYEKTFSETSGSNMGGLLSSLSTSTPTNLPGLTGEAGYSFSEVAALGITGPSNAAFTIAANSLPSGHLAFTNPQDTFNEGKPMTFFYVSTDAPTSGTYQVNDDFTGAAASYVPMTPIGVPVPAAACMGLVVMAGIAGFGLLRRRMAAA